MYTYSTAFTCSGTVYDAIMNCSDDLVDTIEMSPRKLKVVLAIKTFVAMFNNTVHS